MHTSPRTAGWIEVICGPMFSGKTEELIRRLRRSQIAKQQVQIFKPSLDDRYHQQQIVSHSDQRMESVAVENAAQILERVSQDVDVVGIDEAQFFGPALVPICERLADVGVRVIVAGLDQDYRGRPFEPMPSLLAVAEYITKNLAICIQCGNPASRSQRLSKSEALVLVSGAESYEARCRHCHQTEVVQSAES